MTKELINSRHQSITFSGEMLVNVNTFLQNLYLGIDPQRITIFYDKDTVDNYTRNITRHLSDYWSFLYNFSVNWISPTLLTTYLTT